MPESQRIRGRLDGPPALLLHQAGVMTPLQASMQTATSKALLCCAGTEMSQAAVVTVQTDPTRAVKLVC